LKVALVLPGPVSDGTFNSAAAKGIKAAQAKYPNITVSIRENTGMAQSEAALFEYASNGYDVVIGHGFQFAEGAKKIHSQFPKTWFIINTAKIAEAPNLASFDNRWGDGGYVAGAIAGIMTKSGTIGAVGVMKASSAAPSARVPTPRPYPPTLAHSPMSPRARKSRWR
jgi:basic membrane protein A